MPFYRTFLASSHMNFNFVIYIGPLLIAVFYSVNTESATPPKQTFLSIYPAGREKGGLLARDRGLTKKGKN